MGLDDMVSAESALIAAAAATVFSERTRGVVRRGAVLGVAGALKAGDVVAGAARGVVRGARGEETAGSANGGRASRTPARKPRTTSASRRSS